MDGTLKDMTKTTSGGTIVTNFEFPKENDTKVLGIKSEDSSISWVGGTGSTRCSCLAKVLTVIGVKVWVLLGSFPLFQNKKGELK